LIEAIIDEEDTKKRYTPIESKEKGR